MQIQDKMIKCKIEYNHKKILIKKKNNIRKNL